MLLPPVSVMTLGMRLVLLDPQASGDDIVVGGRQGRRRGLGGDLDPGVYVMAE